MLQTKLENALTAMLGRPVTVEKMKANPLTGAVEITGLRGGEDLQIRRISGQIAPAKLLKKQISIKFLEIEGVVVRLGNLSIQKSSSKGDSWGVEAQSMKLRDASVHLGNRDLSLEKISAALQAQNGELRMEFEIGEVKIANRIVNAHPIKGTGSFDSGEDLLAIVAAKFQMGMQMDIDFAKLLGANQVQKIKDQP